MSDVAMSCGLLLYFVSLTKAIDNLKTKLDVVIMLQAGNLTSQQITMRLSWLTNLMLLFRLLKTCCSTTMWTNRLKMKVNTLREHCIVN